MKNAEKRFAQNGTTNMTQLNCRADRTEAKKLASSISIKSKNPHLPLHSCQRFVSRVCRCCAPWPIEQLSRQEKKRRENKKEKEHTNWISVHCSGTPNNKSESLLNHPLEDTSIEYVVSRYNRPVRAHPTDLQWAFWEQWFSYWEGNHMGDRHRSMNRAGHFPGRSLRWT